MAIYIINQNKDFRTIIWEELQNSSTGWNRIKPRLDSSNTVLFK